MAEKIPDRWRQTWGLAAAGSTPGIHAAAGITTIRPIRSLLKKLQRRIEKTACGLCKTEGYCREALL